MMFVPGIRVPNCDPPPQNCCSSGLGARLPATLPTDVAFVSDTVVPRRGVDVGEYIKLSDVRRVGYGVELLA